MIIRKSVLMVLSLLVGISSFGHGVSSSDSEPKQVAVFVYCDKSVNTPINALRARLTSTLVNEVGDSYQVVDRTAEIMSVLQSEYDYQGSGLVRDDQLVSIGEHLGANYICVVSVTYYSDFNQYTFECKLVNIETRRIEKQSMYPDDEETIVSSLSPQMQYKVGGALSGMFNMDVGTTTDMLQNDSVDESIPFHIVETKPSFNGGDANQFSLWVGQHLVIPEKFLLKVKRRSRKNQYKVLTQFTVNPDGSVSNVVVVRSADPLLDAEAVRVIKSSPKWEPGRQRGRAVKVTYTFPVVFQLR